MNVAVDDWQEAIRRLIWPQTVFMPMVLENYP